MIQKLERKSLVVQVVEQIEYFIEGGIWPIGSKIPPEQELMEKFAVSRNTLREAIRALVHSGLLETKQGSGTIVRRKKTLDVALERHVQKSTLLDTLEVRFALERQAAKLVAQRSEHVVFDNLYQHLQKAEDAANNGNVQGFIEADLQFHVDIVQNCGNQLLIDLYKPLSDAVYEFIAEIIRRGNNYLSVDHLHIQLVEEMEKGNADKTCLLIETQYQQLQNFVINIKEI